jgi:hypothetical protein
VRAQVQTDLRRRLPAGLVLALAALAATGAGAVRASDRVGTSSEPVVLSADRVRYGDAPGGGRWVLLEGRAAALQAAEGLRANRILVRITTDGRTEPPEHTIDAQAEGHVLGPHGNHHGLTLRTRGVVRMQPYESAGMQAADAMPPEAAGLARRFAPGAEPAPALPAAVEPPADLGPALAGLTPTAAAGPLPGPPKDEALQPAQFDGEGFGEPPALEPLPEEVPLDPGQGAIPSPNPLEGEDVLDGPPAMPPEGAMPPVREGDALAPAPELPQAPAAPDINNVLPVNPGTRRVVNINPRDSGGAFASEVRLAEDGSGMATVVIRGGVNLTAEVPGRGTLDVSADSAVIWTDLGGNSRGAGRLEQRADTPMEVYLEGHVVFRQDSRQVAGDGDQKTVQATSFFMDLRTEWFVALGAELELFDSRLLAPVKAFGDEIRQYRPILGQTTTGTVFGPAEIRADRTLLTASRFPEPGYRFQSRSIDLKELYTPLIGPDGKPVANPNDPDGPGDKAWRIDARGNTYYLGRIPIFYWPRVLTDSDDLDPPIRQVQFRANNYFGQQFLTDWSLFKILGIKKPTAIDGWNLDIDYLSYRGLALGSELGWSGRDRWGDITDPYHTLKSGRDVDRPYFGYFEAWGLKDSGRDVLGPGPAVVTNGPPGAGKRGFQRTSVPPFQDWRGRVQLRDMQWFLPSDAPFDEDFRLQTEIGFTSDRHFLEQYYKRLFDSGLDQTALAYLIRQRENTAWSILAEGNLQPWVTESQWFPKFDYYRLGDSLFGLFTYSQNSGVHYANTHTDVMVNNPNIFAFQPFDPVTATSGAFRSGRAWTSHELDLPIDLDFMRIVPYVQGQLVGWDNQYRDPLPSLALNGVLPEQAFIRGPQGNLLGRAWGGAGARANVMAWRNYPTVESELMNIHGLSHKISLEADYRTTYSSVGINQIGVQDDLDHNTYEYVRRYFALTQYQGGILPLQYDPRYLTLRRAFSPITGTTDVQDTIQTLQVALRQRLQTKRGPEGRRRIIDYATFDVSGTYFPLADRDNFGTPWGQTQYNAEWFIGDRTSLVSNGWFEFFDVTGRPYPYAVQQRGDDPFGVNVITTGISLARPPRGSIFIGYSIINSGVINTSALNFATTYWLSPKWYSSASLSYDFGNSILLGGTVGITRIGADFLTSIGLTVDPQRNSYMFGFELTPRLSPGVRFGSGGGVARFDPRFAPTQ